MFRIHDERVATRLELARPERRSQKVIFHRSSPVPPFLFADIIRATNMIRINIDHLTEAELIDLNHRIVQRLRLISQVHAHKAMLEFRIGDRVTFEPDGGAPVFGILTRYNKKSVTVIADDGHRWNVSPRFLRRVESSQDMAKTGREESAYPTSIIPFKQK